MCFPLFGTFFFNTHHVLPHAIVSFSGGRIFLKFHSFLRSVGSISFDADIIRTIDTHPRRHSNGLICRHQRWQQRRRLPPTPPTRRREFRRGPNYPRTQINNAAASIAADLSVLESTLGVGGSDAGTNAAAGAGALSLVGGRAAYESSPSAPRWAGPGPASRLQTVHVLAPARARLEAANGTCTGAGTSAGTSTDGGGAEDTAGAVKEYGWPAGRRRRPPPRATRRTGVLIPARRRTGFVFSISCPAGPAASDCHRRR